MANFPEVFVVNLDSDEDRLGVLVSQCSDLVRSRLTRIGAIYGKELPRTARLILTGSEMWADRSGAIGCFLSHLKIWEILSDRGDDFFIVLEDDAVPYDLDAFPQIDIPSNSDFVFLNQTMSYNKSQRPPGVIPKCMPLYMSLLGFLERGKLKFRNIGTYGYAISGSGAKKLLGAISTDLLYGHIDWRLIRYSFNESLLNERFSGTEIWDVVTKHHNPHRPPRWNVINTLCLDFPLVRHSGEYPTRIHT